MPVRRLHLVLAAAALLAAAPAAEAGRICLRGYNIDHTEIKNDSLILFHMRDGTTYQNTLPQRCIGLKSSVNGFTYAPSNPGTDELCDNLETFQLNDGTHRTCFMGAFTKLS